jgi:hypothetical protein
MSRIQDKATDINNFSGQIFGTRNFARQNCPKATGNYTLPLTNLINDIEKIPPTVPRLSFLQRAFRLRVLSLPILR